MTNTTAKMAVQLCDIHTTEWPVSWHNTCTKLKVPSIILTVPRYFSRAPLFLSDASWTWGSIPPVTPLMAVINLHQTPQVLMILCFFFSLASKPFLSPLSFHVFPPSPLSFISIGEHRLARLSPSVWTNISLHAAPFHSSILPSIVLYSSPSIISPALPPSKYLTGEAVWIQLDGWRSWLKQAPHYCRQTIWTIYMCTHVYVTIAHLKWISLIGFLAPTVIKCRAVFIQITGKPLYAFKMCF